MKALSAINSSKIILLIILILPFLSGCNNKSSKAVTKTEFVLGTTCSITLYDKSSGEAFEKSFKRLKEIGGKMTINAANSEVDSVNKASGIEYVNVSDDTFYVIKEGKYYSMLSGGIFDISVGPLVKLWNIGTDKAKVPTPDEINKRLPLVSYNNILLNENEKKVKLKNKNMIIDLGGIAKGYAADEVKKILEGYGIKSAIINLGGNVLTIGVNPQGKPWKIGIQNPDSNRGDYAGIVQITSKTVVTSGIYERYFISGGKLFHHILNPFSGYPFDNNLASVTIITDKSIIGDVFSTSAFGKGLEKGMQYVSEQKNMEAIFITKDNKIYITPGLRDSFTVANRNFKLMN